jgi:hypothetical protein
MSEQIRIHQLIDNAKRNNARNALARAQLLYGAPCSDCGKPTSNKEVPSESSLLLANVSTCAAQAIIRPLPVPESVRIARAVQCYIDASVDPLNPDLRFRQYLPRVVPAPCPPLPNTNPPKAPAFCPLPNTPLNPVLPA